MKSISHLTLFVHDQDDALRFYQKLGFLVHTDVQFGTMRWLTICLPEQRNVELVLMLAESNQEKLLVGHQGGGQKPFFSLSTDDCHEEYERLQALGVEFTQAPVVEEWGISAVCKDLYGNIIYLSQPCSMG